MGVCDLKTKQNNSRNRLFCLQWFTIFVHYISVYPCADSIAGFISNDYYIVLHLAARFPEFIAHCEQLILLTVTVSMN